MTSEVLKVVLLAGTGYSYVTKSSAYATTDKQIGIDLVALMKAVVAKFPQFQTNPFWIFCESVRFSSTTISFNSADHLIADSFCILVWWQDDHLVRCCPRSSHLERSDQDELQGRTLSLLSPTCLIHAYPHSALRLPLVIRGSPRLTLS